MLHVEDSAVQNSFGNAGHPAAFVCALIEWSALTIPTKMSGRPATQRGNQSPSEGPGASHTAHHFRPMWAYRDFDNFFFRCSSALGFEGANNFWKLKVLVNFGR